MIHQDFFQIRYSWLPPFSPASIFSSCPFLSDSDTHPQKEGSTKGETFSIASLRAFARMLYEPFTFNLLITVFQDSFIVVFSERQIYPRGIHRKSFTYKDLRHHQYSIRSIGIPVGRIHRNANLLRPS